MSETPTTVEKTGIAFGTYRRLEDLVATIEELLTGELTVQNLCVVGDKNIMFDSLIALQDQTAPKALWSSLFSQTEVFVTSDRTIAGVGSSGSFLDALQQLIARQATLPETVERCEYCIDGSDINTHINHGRLILFINVTKIDVLAHTLRTLLRRSSDNVQSHEYHGLLVT